MAKYSAAVSRSGINSTNSLYWQLRNTANTLIRIAEIGISITVAPSTAPSYYLIRATTTGTASTSINGVRLCAVAPTSQGTFETAWSVAPTFSTTGPNIRQFGLAVTAGGGVIWTFPFPLELAASEALCIVNANASGATTGTHVAYVTWEE